MEHHTRCLIAFHLFCLCTLGQVAGSVTQISENMLSSPRALSARAEQIPIGAGQKKAFMFHQIRDYSALLIIFPFLCPVYGIYRTVYICIVVHYVCSRVG